MIKHRKERKTLQTVGKQWHNFDFAIEKIIYSYLCCKNIKKKKVRNLDKELKFESYQQWKNYIRSKYENFDQDHLSEFSRYLNQRLRDMRPYREYRLIVTTALITWLFTETVNISQKMDDQRITVIFSLLFLAGVFVELVVLLTLKPIFENNIEENLLRDYKEIIDEMITEKMKS